MNVIMMTDVDEIDAKKAALLAILTRRSLGAACVATC
jgi:hypothetical protein